MDRITKETNYTVFYLKTVYNFPDVVIYMLIY